jgi:hypothetical protein
MKVMQRGIMKILPGKMAEAMALNEKYMAIVSRLGMPLTAMRMYHPFIGGPEYMHTIVFEVEWDDFGTMAAFFEKAMADPEVQAMMPKWDATLESHEVELYVPMP